MARRGISTSENRTTKMTYANKSIADAPDEEFPAPDGAVVSIAGSVKTDPYDALVPFAAFG
jgi:hypothetical protein